MELVTFLNPKIDTMRSVIHFAGERFPGINRACFLEAGNPDFDANKVRNQVRRSFGSTSDILYRQADRKDLQSQVPEILADRLQANGGRDSVVVDMTNGTKKMSSILYATASLLKIENLISVRILDDDVRGRAPEAIDREQVRIEEIHLLENRARVSEVGFFEVFYYRDRMEKLLTSINIQSFTSVQLREQMHDELLLAVERYFSGRYRDTAHQVGLVAEQLVFEVCEAISQHAQADITKTVPEHSDPGGAANWLKTNFCEPVRSILRDDPHGKAAEHGNRDGKRLKPYQKKLRSLATADFVFHQLRVLRNFASHGHHPDFQGKSEAKSALQSMLYLLEMIVESEVFE